MAEGTTQAGAGLKHKRKKKSNSTAATKKHDTFKDSFYHGLFLNKRLKTYIEYFAVGMYIFSSPSSFPPPHSHPPPSATPQRHHHTSKEGRGWSLLGIVVLGKQPLQLEVLQLLPRQLIRTQLVCVQTLLLPCHPHLVCVATPPRH